MANQNVRGRFVWHELETPEHERAHEFYSAVLGWRTEPFEQDPSYAMFAASSGPLGGSVALRDDGARWLPYVETDDIDATLAEARRLGASVHEDVTAIPNGSKYAILRDPQGARFAVYQSGALEEETAGESRIAGLGEFNWHELATEDFRAAFDFYSRLFGWETVSEYDMGPRGVYLIFGREGQSLGGIFNKGDAGLRGDAYWLGYVRVSDVHDASALVKARGGTVAAGPMEVPGGDWIAQCIDPQGALFALQTSAEDMRSLQGGADEASSSGSSPSAAAAVDADSDEVPLRKAASKKRSSKKRSSKKRSSKKQSSKKPATKKAGEKKAGKKKAAKKKSAQKKSAKKKSAKKKAATKKAATKKPAAKKAGSKKAASKKVAKKAGSKKKSAKKKTSKKTSKKKAAKQKPAKKKAGKKKARAKKAPAKNKKARAKKTPTKKTRRR